MTLLTVEDVAKRLQVHPEVVRRYLRSGELRGIQIGGRWRIAEEDLAAFIEDQRGKAVA